MTYRQGTTSPHSILPWPPISFYLAYALEMIVSIKHERLSMNVQQRFELMHAELFWVSCSLDGALIFS